MFEQTEACKYELMDWMPCGCRHWVVVRSNGDFVTQRQLPKMALIQTEVRGATMALNAPGMPPLTIPLAPSFTTDNVVNCRCVVLYSGCRRMSRC